MAARKAKAYQVKGAAAVIRKSGHERYVDRGAIFLADALDEENAKHLLGAGLIEEVELAAESGDEAEAKAAAEKAAAEAKAKAEAEAKAAK
ncbi:hypothetical protein [Microbacterium sp.]|uniref:hypothetical protein n=1 Tax=Microbacterium sp. TaxID=51671 RepID=UPI003A8E6704